MPQLSPNIGLPLYDRTADKPELFIDYRDEVNGTGSTSGFSIIDDKFGEVDTTLNTLKGVGWTDESLVENAQAIAALKEKGVYTAFASGTNTLTATITDFVGAPPNNAVIILVPSALNTTTATLSINSETAKPLTVPRGKSGTVSYDPLSAKDLRPNVPMVFRKSSDGVRYIAVGFGESYAKDVFYDNGGGTYTTAQAKFDEKVNKAGDTMSGTLKFNRGVNVRSYKDVLHYTNPDIIIGTLKITMPMSWSSTMLSGKIKGFQYENNKSWELDFDGYNILGSTQWLTTTAKVNGQCPFSKVRFAYDGTKCCLLIGDLTTSWSFPRITITDFIASLTNVDGWETGWSASIITSETGLTNIVEPTLQGTTPTETVITTGFPSGFSGTIKIRKNQEDLKVVDVNITKTSDIALADTAYTFAVDYRPLTTDAKFFCQGLASDGSTISGATVSGFIETSTGNMKLIPSGTVTANVRRFRFTFSYY